MNLKSMTDFVLEQEQNYANVTRCVKKNPFLLVVDYAKFMKQVLTLGMFVPCDEKGKPLLEPEMRPERNSFDEEDMDYDAQELYEYIQAKEKVLFKGFEIKRNAGLSGVVERKEDGQSIYVDDRVLVENLVKLELELTESALKQIGIEKSTSGNTGQVPPTSTPNY